MVFAVEKRQSLASNNELEPGTADDRRPPTESEKKTLRHVHGAIPWIAFILCIVEFAERASYYGATQVFNNFLQYPLPPGKLSRIPSALY
jgi:proton-dependent oligopeptide transporter, POT family